MTEEEKRAFLDALEEEILKGGAELSEWATRIALDATEAFFCGQYLATLLTAMAAIETHLRFHYGSPKMRLSELVDQALVEDTLKMEIHALRQYRNRWVHIEDPWDEAPVIHDLELVEKELFGFAKRSIEAMYRVLYCEQWV